MKLSNETCYRALRTRDARFDGRFFTAVTSTGVYCRPVCPARTPKLQNVRFYSCAAAAQEAGFRPCLRCRPETAPGSAPWRGTSTTVHRGMRLIAAGALNEGNVETLAGQLGVGTRHLRRLFQTHLGTSPLQVAQTHRILSAKQLLSDTQLPLQTIALIAGFGSVRRFNECFRQVFSKTPGEMRKKAGIETKRRSRSSYREALELELAVTYREPFDWQHLLNFLSRRAIPHVELVVDQTYYRVLAHPKGQGLLEITPLPGQSQLAVRLCCSSAAMVMETLQSVRNVFDTDADPHQIARHLSKAAILSKSIDRNPGIRVPGTFDGFELAIRAILGQQISVAGARTLAGRLVGQFGSDLSLKTSIDSLDSKLALRCFPTAKTLCKADLRGLGLTKARQETIRILSREVAEGRIVLNPGVDLLQTRKALLALPGIGPWTAEYIAMRALRDPDAFPSSDLGVRKALATSKTPVSAKVALRLAEEWRPWRAYTVMHLWNMEG